MASQEHYIPLISPTPAQLKGNSTKPKDGQLSHQKRKKGGVDDIYQAISDAIKSTLGEFDLLESNNSGNQLTDPNEIIPELKKSALNFQIEDFFNPMKGQKGNQLTSSQSSLQKLLMSSAMMLGSGSNKMIKKDGIPSQISSQTGQNQLCQGKILKKRLKQVLQDKIEKIRVKQVKKREQKIKLSQIKKLSKSILSAQNHDNLDSQIPMVPKEVIIRLKPFTDASKDFITKDKKKNALLQFRLTIMVPQSCPSQQQQQLQAERQPNQNRTVRDLIKLIANRWDLRQRQIELRLCLSPADLVQNDPRKLKQFDKKNSISVRISDLLTNQHKLSIAPVTLYLLYEIKKMHMLPSFDDLDDEEIGTDTEDELNMEDEDGYDQNESSHSSVSKSLISHLEENKQDEEEQEFVDIFTDILGLIVLNKKQKEAEEEEETAAAKKAQATIQFDRLKDSQMVPIMQMQKQHSKPPQPQIVEEASSMCESEMPQFAQGLEYYSQFKQINAEPGSNSIPNNDQGNVNPNFKLSFTHQLQKKPSISFGNHSIVHQESKSDILSRSLIQQINATSQMIQAAKNEKLAIESQVSFQNNNNNINPQKMDKFTLSPTNNNSIRSGNAPTVNAIVPGMAKITSFKDYFETKKLSSSANQSVKDGKQVEEMGQDSMKCKEQINQNSNLAANFSYSLLAQKQSAESKPNISLQKSSLLVPPIQPVNQSAFGLKDLLIKPAAKKEPSFDIEQITGVNTNLHHLLGDDEHSLIKSINFFQNSNLNPYNSMYQHPNAQAPKLSFSPFQYGGFENNNSNMFGASQIMLNTKINSGQKFGGAQQQSSISNVFNKTNVTVAPFEDITPKKLNFKQNSNQISQAEEVIEKVLAEEVKKEEPKQSQQQQCQAIPHPDSIFQQIKIENKPKKEEPKPAQPQQQQQQQQVPSKPKKQAQVPPPQGTQPGHQQQLPQFPHYQQQQFYPQQSYYNGYYPQYHQQHNQQQQQQHTPYHQTFINNNMLFFNQQFSQGANQQQPHIMPGQQGVEKKKKSQQQTEVKIQTGGASAPPQQQQMQAKTPHQQYYNPYYQYAQGQIYPPQAPTSEAAFITQQDPKKANRQPKTAPNK